MNEGSRLGRVLVCPPGREYARVDDTVRQNFVAVPDAELASAQHAALVRALERAGAEVVEIRELEGHPNSVFVRDVALVTGAGAVRLRMGLPARRGEEDWMAAGLGAFGVEEVGGIEPPGTVEGGDVFLMGEVALVGLSERANAEGARQLTELLGHLGCRVRTAPVPPPAFHLGSLLSPVGAERVVCVAGTLPPEFLEGLDVIEVPRASAATTANVLCLGEGDVLADVTESPETLDALDRAGVRIHALDLSEFAKGSGGPTCLALPLARG